MVMPRKGFSIIEIIVVVGIISILLMVVVPNYIKTRRESAAAACIATMKQIEVAILRWSSDRSVPIGGEVDEDEVYQYLTTGRPRCPAGGTYILEPVGNVPPVKCTRINEGHSL